MRVAEQRLALQVTLCFDKNIFTLPSHLKTHYQRWIIGLWLKETSPIPASWSSEVFLGSQSSAQGLPAKQML